MAHQHQLNPSFLLDGLYCEEEKYWDDGDDENDCFEANGEVKSGTILKEHDLFWEEEELASLLSKEKRNELIDDLEKDPCLAESRGEAVDWILRVVGHYSFSALTAVLAVNYLDRFLFSFQFQREKPWMTQLVAVSCLSLAAKVEETQVPLLLDLQVEETQYVFEAKTIQRMEILVLSSLKWKMNPVTPLSFLDYIARRLGLKNHLCWEFLNRGDCLLLSIIADCRFMCYLPSVIATATVLLVINSVEPSLGVTYQTELLGILGIDKSKIEDCCKLIRELTSGGYGRNINKRKFGSLPGSPKGVMDLSFSSDSSNDSWAATESTSAPTSVSSSPEPLSKKARVQDQHKQNLGNAAADILSIPL